PAILHLRSPFGLSNWTLPVLELMMVAGAVLALVHSVRRLRRDGDPTNLALWFATVLYLCFIEIPLYFPNIFGVEDQIGVVFAHNTFTVQFLFDRLPLYIVALYPAVVTLAFEIVRSLGVFRDRGVLVGAICVGFVHHCFYEVFDQLGPQLRWWAWNTDNPINHPLLASVPMTSVFIFATLGPIVVTVLVMLLIGRKANGDSRFSRLGLVWRTVVAGALVPVGVAVLSIPSSLFDGDKPKQAIVFTVELVLVAAIAVPVLARQWLQSRGNGTVPNDFVRLFGPVYLGVLAVLWGSALPAYVASTAGITADGTPVGNLGYATVSFVFAALSVLGVSIRRGTRPVVGSEAPALGAWP
ncbi:MAG: hypothetical protein ABWY93_11190, partial [Mycobacterium sp.]